jgi:hypothetical protein
MPTLMADGLSRYCGAQITVESASAHIDAEHMT